MSVETSADGKPVFTVTSRQQGHAQVTLHGIYTGTATAADVEREFYHSYFGGSGAWARDGKWGCVRYID